MIWWWPGSSSTEPLEGTGADGSSLLALTPGRPRPAPSRLRFCFDEQKQQIMTVTLSFLSGSREWKVSPGFFFRETSSVFLSSAHLDATGRRRDSWCHRRRDRPAEPQSNYPVHCSIQQRVPERHRTGLITEQTQLISPDTFYSFWTDRKTETNPSCIMQTSRLQPLTGAI